MYKKIFRYFLFYILPVNLLFAQESGINKEYPVNNINVNKTDYRDHQSLINNGFTGSNGKITTTVVADKLYKLLLSLLKVDHNSNNKETRKPFLDYFFNSGSSGDSRERPEKNLMASISQNIEIGGISGKYAVISFIPKLSIEPVDFISISANQNVRYLIPITTINEHLQLLFFQSAYILAIDNFMNLLSKTHTITQSIVGFVAKNIISSLVSKSIDTNSKYKAYSITSYYYSIKIRL
jgi:hypothetical protein